MIDYNSITGRAQESANKLYDAAEKRDLSDLAHGDKSTHRRLHLPTLSQIQSIVMRLSSAGQKQAEQAVGENT